MKKTFVIVSVSDRIEQLNALMQGIRNDSRFDDFDICLLYQDYLNNEHLLRKDLVTHYFSYPKRLGCNCARIMLLQKIKYDIYCNLDDDMTLMPYTNYEKPIQKLIEDKSSGFILTNWARTESLYEKKIQMMTDKFVKQCFIYQGGGMLYRDDVADLIRKLPLQETVFDEGWALTAYLKGYENYRYLGSVAIHSICTKGGMAQWYKDIDYTKLSLLFDDYINYRKAKDGVRYHIPIDSDLKTEAKAEHNKCRGLLLHKLNLNKG